MKLFIQWLQSICLIFGIFSSSLLHVLQMTQLKESDILLVIEVDIIYSGKLGFRMTCIWLNKVQTFFFFFLVLVLLWTNNLATLLCLEGDMLPQWPHSCFHWTLSSKRWTRVGGYGYLKVLPLNCELKPDENARAKSSALVLERGVGWLVIPLCPSEAWRASKASLCASCLPSHGRQVLAPAPKGMWR